MGQIVERKVRNYSGTVADMALIPAGARAVNDLYFTTDTKACYRWDGAAWVGPVPSDWITALMLQTDSVETLKIKAANVTLAKLAPNAIPAFEHALLHIQDQKASGVQGGDFTAGAWRTRVLNTVLTNEIAGASLNANQITLPAGTYFIIASAPAILADQHKTRLYNITDAGDILIGTSTYSGSGAYYAQTRSIVSGRFTIAAEKVIEFQHRAAATRNVDGFGTASTFGVVEVYADVLIWRAA